MDVASRVARGIGAPDRGVISTRGRFWGRRGPDPPTAHCLFGRCWRACTGITPGPCYRSWGSSDRPAGQEQQQAHETGPLLRSKKVEVAQLQFPRACARASIAHFPPCPGSPNQALSAPHLRGGYSTWRLYLAKAGIVPCPPALHQTLWAAAGLKGPPRRFGVQGGAFPL